MADENAIRAALQELAKSGFQFGDIMKALKGAKDDGIIKSKGRGKLPEDDPLRNAIKNALASLKLKHQEDGKPAVDGSLLDLITKATAETEATSLMVTLNDQWKVNFVKSMPKEKKEKSEKQEKKETQPADFTEPQVV